MKLKRATKLVKQGRPAACGSAVLHAVTRQFARICCTERNLHA